MKPAGLEDAVRTRLFRERPLCASQRFLIRRKLIAEATAQLAELDTQLSELSAKRQNLARFLLELSQGRPVR